MSCSTFSTLSTECTAVAIANCFNKGVLSY